MSDFSVEQKRILIFSTDSCLDALQHPQAVGPNFVDGTFATAPAGFVQNWIIRGSLTNDNLGMLKSLSAYALIQNKTAVSYLSVREEVKMHAPLWSPSSFVCDFELAERNALNQAFPGRPIHGCHFHYCQCLMKQFNKFPGYANDD